MSTDPPTPVKILAGAMKKIAAEFINEDGRYEIPEKYDEDDKETMISILEHYGKLGKDLRKVQSKGRRNEAGPSRAQPSSAGPSREKRKDDAPEAGPNVELLKQLENSWKTASGDPMNPLEACQLLREEVESTDPAATKFVRALKRSCRGLTFGSKEDWEEAMNAAGFESASLEGLAKASKGILNTQDKVGRAVKMITLLDDVECSTNTETLIRSIGYKVVSIQALSSYRVLNEQEKKKVRLERYELHCRKYPKSTQKSKERFVSDMAKEVLAWKRLARIALKLGPYALLDPGYSLQSFKSNNKAGELFEMCMEVIEGVIEKKASTAWFHAQDECSIQAIMAIILGHCPHLVPNLVKVLERLGLDTSNEVDDGDDKDKDKAEEEEEEENEDEDEDEDEDGDEDEEEE